MPEDLLQRVKEVFSQDHWVADVWEDAAAKLESGDLAKELMPQQATASKSGPAKKKAKA